MGKDVIIACDFSSAEATFAFLDQFTGRKPFVNIGMELYYAEGPSIVKESKARGHKIFLDLKLHDRRLCPFCLTWMWISPTCMLPVRRT